MYLWTCGGREEGRESYGHGVDSLGVDVGDVLSSGGPK